MPISNVKYYSIPNYHCGECHDSFVANMRYGDNTTKPHIEFTHCPQPSYYEPKCSQVDGKIIIFISDLIERG